MVDVSGHVGFALLASVPIWFVADRRKTALAFLAVSVPFGLVPDVDLWLARVFPTVKHHGVVHTVLAVGVAALVVGPLLGRRLHPYLVEHGAVGPDETRRSTAFAVIAALTGGLSHLFADVLSAPDISEPIEPFWPVIQGSVGFDVFYYNAFWPNFGLLAVGALVTAGLWAWRGRPELDGRTADA